MTSAFNVTPAAATQLVVTTQPPSSVAVGSAFGLVVSAEDPYGNVDPTFNGSVAVALSNNPGGATLGGTLTATAQTGVTTFSGLTLNNGGIGYTLHLSSSGLTTATTNAFDVDGPTIYTVDLTSANGTGSGNAGDLVYAIGLANANTNPGGSEIEFDSSVFSSELTITLGATLVLSETAGPELIDGPAAGVTISGGGAVSVFEVDSGVAATLSGLTISGGSTTGNGGGLENDGTATLTDCTISGNSAAGNGGGVDNEGSATLTNCTVSGNTAGDSGGLANYSTIMLTGCTISGNSGVQGGGISNELSGTAAVTQSTLTNNTAVVGGGIFNLGELTISGTAIASNSATSGGGGVISSAGTATFTDCTVADNAAASGAGGGGLFDNGGTMVLTASTIFGNSAGGGSGGGGLFDPNTGAVATLTDTIIAGNVDPGGTPDDINGSNATDVTGSFNLIGLGGSGGIVGGTDGNIVLSSLAGLGLAPLGDYGGPTETMALLPGSAAIGVGTAVSGITTDQRGEPLDSPPDIGAFQTQTGLVVNTTSDDTGSPSGDLSLRQAINLANALGGTETITFDPTIFATAQTITLTQGQLELSDTSGMETIMGPAAGVTVSGGGQSRVFQVDSGVTATLSGLTISGGSTTGNGGGLYNDGGTVTLIACTISGNSSAAGGGLFNTKRGTGTIHGCLMSGNSAGLGGGLYNDGGTVTLTGSTVSGNSAASGGGLFNTKRGTGTIHGCLMSGNFAGLGGGLYNDGGTTTLTGSTVSGNSATSGGGLFNTKSGTGTLTGCTLSGNSAAAGGGFYNSSTMNLYACTIGANSAAVGGAIDNVTDGGATLEDTIVATNTGTGGAPSDIGGANSGGVVGTYDLVGTGGSGGIAGGTGDIVLTNLNGPLLGPLGSYGGPTPTMPLLPGSAAIGTGTAISGVTTDQRGLAVRRDHRHRRLPGPDRPGGQFHTRRRCLALGRGEPAPGRQSGQRAGWHRDDHFRLDRLRDSTNDHSDAGPARAERHGGDRDDHWPGGGRDGQRRRALPGVPGR